MGIIKKPYLENSLKEIGYPLSESIFAHMRPASAPISVKFAPKLLPAINAVVEPSLAVWGAAKEGLWKALTKNIVIGWLFIMPAAREDRKPMLNIIVIGLPEIFES